MPGKMGHPQKSNIVVSMTIVAVVVVVVVVVYQGILTCMTYMKMENKMAIKDKYLMSWSRF